VWVAILGVGVAARLVMALGGGWLGRGGSPTPFREVPGCGPLSLGREPPHIWAQRPPAARPRLPRRERRPKPRPARVTVGEQATDQRV
jgi:hypothetical protein